MLVVHKLQERELLENDHTSWLVGDEARDFDHGLGEFGSREGASKNGRMRDEFLFFLISD